MNSIDMRLNPLFHRAGFEKNGLFELPMLKKVNLNLDNIRMIPLSKTKQNDTAEHCKFGVHCFEDDYRMTSLYNNPEKSLNAFSYITQICVNGFQKGWRKLGKLNLPDSKKVSLSDNIYSI